MNDAAWRRIELRQGDITRLAVDAIVNAANEALAGGGGVDGAIHRAAGLEKVQTACRALGGCSTGDAKVTLGFNLPARLIIHTVGPVYRDGCHGEPEKLASAYRRSLEVAVENDASTIAFPAISTGVYGYPFEDATRLALTTILKFLESDMRLTNVILIFFSKPDFDSAVQIATEMSGAAPRVGS